MRIPKLIQNSAIYTVIQILQKGISFFLLPIYTAYLTPSDYGVLGVTSSISSFLAIFITFSLSSAATRFYYKNNQDENYCRRIFGTIAFVSVLNSVLIGTLIILFHEYILDPISGEISFYPFLLLSILHTILTPLYTLYQDYLRTKQEGFHFGLNSLSYFILNVSLVIISLTVYDLGVVGVLLANLVTAIVFFLYVAFTFLKRIDFRIDRLLIKDSLSYSLPLLPHTLANWSNGMIDNLLVNGMRSQSDAGIYNLGQQYGCFLNNIAIGINSAFTPWFYDRVNEGEKTYKVVSKVSEVAVAAISLIAVVMTLFSKEVLGIMTSSPAYSEVWRIVPFIAGAYIFQGVYFFFIQTLFLNDTKVIFIVTITTVVINVTLNLILIPQLGFYGCAIACFATYLLKSVMAAFVSKKRHCNPYFDWHVLYCIAFMGVGIGMATLVDFNVSFLGLFLIKLVIISLATLFVFLYYKDTIIFFLSSIRNKDKQ